MLRIETIADGKIRYSNDDDLFDGYYVMVERKTIDMPDDAGGSVTFGMLYFTTPEKGPHALTGPDEAEQLANGLFVMLSAATSMGRLMDNADDASFRQVPAP